MLKSFRSLVSGVGAYVVVGVVILAFAFVGVPALSNFGSGDALEVGDRGYSLQDVQQELRNEIRNYQERSGEVVSTQRAVELGLLDRSIRRLADGALIEQEAQRLGMAVSDSMLRPFLENQQEPDIDGTRRFDRETLGRILNASGYSLSQYRDVVRAALYQQQFIDGLGVTVPAPDDMAELFLLKQAEQRTVRLATLAVPEPVAPTEEQLRAYFDTEEDQYATPERRSFAVLLLDADTLIDRIEIDPADVQQLFEARRAQLGQPERRTFTQASFSSEAEANAALAAIEAGASLEDAAAATGTAVITFTEETETALADADVAAVIFASEEPGIVGPVEGVFGTVVADVQSITPGVDIKFEDVADDLEQELFDELVIREGNAVYTEIQDAGDGGLSLRDAAGEVGLSARVIGPVDRTLTLEDGSLVNNLPAPVVRRAFSMSAGGLFEEVDLPGGITAFVEVVSITPAALRPFDAAREDVEADYRGALMADAAAELEAEFRSLVAQGQPFEIAALTLGGSVETRTLSLTQLPVDIRQDLLVELFDAPIGEFVSGSASPFVGMDTAQSVVVGLVEGITFGAVDQSGALLDLGRQQLGQMLANDHLTAYLNAAETDFPAKQNDQLLNAAFGQGN